jgi:hypothetical protein
MIAPHNAKRRASLGFYLFCDLGGDEILDGLLDYESQFITGSVRVDSRLILEKNLGQIEALGVEFFFVFHNNLLRHYKITPRQPRNNGMKPAAGRGVFARKGRP